MQQEQLTKLKELTSKHFTFIPAHKNKYGVKYYEHKCTSEAEFQKLEAIFNRHKNIFYTCIEYTDNTFSIAILQNQSDKSRIESIMWGLGDETAEIAAIGKIHGNDILLETIPTTSGKAHNIVSHSNRAVTIVNINGHRLPFYVSSGISGKESEYGIDSGKWYPLQGISSGGWLNKMPNMNKNPYPELDQICEILEKKFPATKFKQLALNNKLPVADNSALLTYANSSFPEGTPLNEYGVYQYYRNHLIYLPSILDAWRSHPSNYLEISNGPLQASKLNTLAKIRKTDLMANTSLTNDLIWLKPVQHQLKSKTDAETIQGIQSQLNSMGICTNTIVHSDNQEGFGIPIRAFLNYFKEQQTQSFVSATNKINNTKTPPSKQEMFFHQFTKRLKDFFNN